MACLALAAILLAGERGGSAQEIPQEPSFEAEITVALKTLVIRAVDTWGRPILGLKPEDLRVRVGKQEIPVVGLDWVGEEGTAATPLAAAEVAAEGPPVEAVEAPAGHRLLVFFVQTDLNPTRISGQLRLRRFTRELLDTFQSRDRVAVVSYDSHLKLWRDFTADREGIHAAIDRAMLWSPEGEVAPGDPVSLAGTLDPEVARKAASPERALEVLGKALEPLPGEKTVIYLGWGLGRFGSNGVQMSPDYKPAVRALAKAQASVFVLDVTSADYHSLEVGLESVAQATGGTYQKTFRLPQLATRTLAETISGHYVLTLDRELSEESGKLRIDLRNHQGTVLARSPAAL